MNYKFRKKLHEDVTNNSFEEKVAYAKQQLQNGADPKDVFDLVYVFWNGFTSVRLDGKYNFIDRNGNILSDLWFDWFGKFSDGFTPVRLDKKWNYIDRNGNLLRDDLWFDFVGDFHNGFAKVKLKDKYNFINTDGNFLSDLWFDDVSKFQDGFAEVKLDGKTYYLDKKGNLYDEDENPIENVTENRRRVLRITESQLRNTIKKVVTQYLNEGRRR